MPRRRDTSIVRLLCTVCCMIAASAVSCTQKEVEYVEETLDDLSRPALYFVHRDGAMGDLGYVDNIYSALSSCATEKNMLFSSVEYVPDTMTEYSIEYFIRYAKNLSNQQRRSLIVVLNDNMEELVRRYESRLDELPGTDILLVESPDSTLAVNTLCVSTVGVLYQAGRLVGEVMDSVNKVLVVTADSVTPLLSSMHNAFLDGLDESGRKVEADWMSLDGVSGYEALDSMYRFAYSVADTYQLVLPLCGGSARGFYRYNSEHPSEFYTLGVDLHIKQISFYDKDVPFSVTKDIQSAVKDWVEDWYNGKKQARHIRYGMESYYTGLELTEEFVAEHGEVINRLEKAAIKKESEYEN